MQDEIIKTKGQLYIIATPIGNLSDITLRAITILKNVDLIAAEDTRHSRHLLSHYGISTACQSLHEHNEKIKIHYLINLLKEGKQIGLISDAGTPLISDPGYRLVQEAHQAGIVVSPIPGPCAAIAALSVAGLPTDQFLFYGFLPAKGEERKKKLTLLLKEPRTVILYESVHRIKELLCLLEQSNIHDRMMCVARELTKTFESIKTGFITELLAWFQQFPQQLKGEFVVLISPASSKADNNKTHVLSILLKELPLKQAVSLAAKITQGNRNELYQLALAITKD